MAELTRTNARHPEGQRAGYRPELDAIRGVAILLVMLDHGTSLFAGVAGAAGVNVFFVLSGYLITGNLLGGIGLREFYERRIRRLAPALIVFLAVVTLLGLPGNLPPALFYYANLEVAQHGLASMGWLGHTWSLSMEEQFYLVWPALFLAIGRSRRLAVVLLLAAIAASATFAGVVVSGTLAAGCLLAVLGFELPRFAVPRWLVRTGQVSYGLYLWNFPVSLFAFHVIGDADLAHGAAWLAVSGAVTVALALVSERWIERPFRLERAGHRSERRGSRLPVVPMERAGVAAEPLGASGR